MKLGPIVLILWILILLGLLLAPIRESQIPTLWGFQHSDKIAHFGLFFVTGLAGVFGATFFKSFRARMWFGIVLGLLLALGTEFGQAFLPVRNMSFYDLIADVAGLSVALLLSVFVYYRNPFGLLSRFR